VEPQRRNGNGGSEDLARVSSILEESKRQRERLNRELEEFKTLMEQLKVTREEFQVLRDKVYKSSEALVETARRTVISTRA
jgi:hypothetical protein